MKLLSVANVGTLLGGTGACTYSCVKALPDWQHSVVFFGGMDNGLEDRFGCEVRKATAITPQLIDEIKPDVILFHNTNPERMPSSFPEGCLTVFYQHSAVMSLRESRRRCNLVLSVSHHLAKQANIREDFVLYQPVPVPPAEGERKRITLGRMSTAANKSKWEGAEAFYESLSLVMRSNYELEFVGAPESFEANARQTFTLGRGSFHPASVAARRLLWTWAGMLYSSPVEESYGRTVCESQRAGCIPIVDRKGGFIEQIRHGETGFLCSSIDEFADAARKVITGTHGIDIAAMQKAGDERGGLAVWRRKFL
ncbi:MAG: glycosyltransferase, partial [Planctomycetaceae bacterium]|nr:glycosyltransferase [Planctomycetaceae bacterium]